MISIWKLGRDKKRSNGICLNCLDKATHGKCRCEKCRIKHNNDGNRRHAIKKENKICRSCPEKTISGTLYCEKHLLKARTTDKKSYDKKIKNDLCVSCPNKAINDNLFCEEHWFESISIYANKKTNKIETNSKILIEIYNNQNKKCAITGKLIHPGTNMSLDHIVPISKDGTNENNNLQWIWSPLNQFKSNDDIKQTKDNLMFLCGLKEDVRLGESYFAGKNKCWGCDNTAIINRTRCNICIFGCISSGANKSTKNHKNHIHVSYKDLLLLYKSQNGMCPISKKFIYPGYNMEIDHIVPISKSGNNELSNLRFLWTPINQFKGCDTEEQFQKNLKELKELIIIKNNLPIQSNAFE